MFVIGMLLVLVFVGIWELSYESLNKEAYLGKTREFVSKKIGTDEFIHISTQRLSDVGKDGDWKDRYLPCLCEVTPTI